MLGIVIPLARPGIVAVAVLVAVFTWNDFGGSLVLIQKPDAFTAQLALSRFSTFYATDEGLTFAGMAIAIIPPMLLFLVLQRSFIRGLTRGSGSRLKDRPTVRSPTPSGRIGDGSGWRRGSDGMSRRQVDRLKEGPSDLAFEWRGSGLVAGPFAPALRGGFQHSTTE